MSTNTIKLPFSLALIFALSSNIWAVDTVSIKYCPLKVGNVYRYAWSGSGQGITYSRAAITKDTIMLGRKYFYCFDFPRLDDGWYRTDSISGSLYRFDATGSCPLYTNELLVDSLGMRTGEYLPCNSSQYTLCIGETNHVVFGMPTTVLSFSSSFMSTNTNWAYAKNFGFYYMYCQQSATWRSVSLIGCVINGVLFGDTSIIGIESNNSDIPKIFFLFQNYPNPFNPVTTIKFRIPRRSDVLIKVYDMIGVLMTVLINKRLETGEYEATFDGVNLSSGVYLYQIIADGVVIDTKKMLMLK